MPLPSRPSPPGMLLAGKAARPSFALWRMRSRGPASDSSLSARCTGGLALEAGAGYIGWVGVHNVGRPAWFSRRRALASAMPRLLRLALLFLAAACSGSTAPATVPIAFALPDSALLLDGATGTPAGTPELLRRLADADFVLLGEVHDNGAQHSIRGALLTALAARHPAVVFEQFAETSAPFPPPAAGESEESWLDRNGFDRKSWEWPVHQPIVDAAIAHARSLWGSGISRDSLRAVVHGGESAAPAHLQPLMARTPLDSIARAGIDSELVEGHCHKLPASMIPGMRAAQVVRDAAMAQALLLASATGPAWLIAGDGHVRRDMGVPRLLRVVAPSARLLTIGFLEREENGDLPSLSERRVYDLVIVTSRAVRDDPCAGL